MPSIDLLRCPECRDGTLASADSKLWCHRCSAEFPVRNGVPLLVSRDSPLWVSVEAVNATSAAPPGVARSTNADMQRDYWEAEHGHRAADHPIVKGFAEQRWGFISSLLPLSDLHTALDVGCGNGFSTCCAPTGIEYTGCDGSLHMLEHHPGQRLAMTDARSLPFRDNSFDLVFCWELLHHVDEPWRVLAEMARVSRNYVLLMEPNPLNVAQFVFALVDPEHRWVLRFSKRYVLQQVRKAGLKLAAYRRGGLIFPNKTPALFYPALRALPFRVPFVGISQLVVAKKD